MRWVMSMSPSEVKKIEKVLLEVEKKVEDGGEASVDEVGRAMRSYARAIAPKDTKRLMRLIKYFKAKKGKKEGTLVSQNPTTTNAPQSYHGEHKISNFNLAYWFATSNKAPRHAKRGYARYMDMAASYGDKLFAGIVDREIDKRFK